MRRLIISLFLSLALVFPLVGSACAPKPMMSPADFYKANTVDLICVMSPGGGVDFSARIFASYWSEVTGGTMVVRNMPGGGGLVGAK